MRLSIIILSTFMVVGCPATSMLSSLNTTSIQPPPNIRNYATMESFLFALNTYKQYIEDQHELLEKRYGFNTNKPTVTPNCDAVSLVKQFTLPTPDPIVSDEPEGQLMEVLDYVDRIRASANLHNRVIDSELALYVKLCPTSI